MGQLLLRDSGLYDRMNLPASQIGRRIYLDRLRTAACLSTFFYHSMQVFDANPYYHVKSHTADPVIDVFARLLHTSRMPLFFLIAGMAGFLALKHLTNGEVIRKRAKRLLPPLILGVMLFAPAIKYFEVLDGRTIGLSGLKYLSGEPPELEEFLRNFFTIKWFSWSHLWFPAYLFLLWAALLPALRAMSRAGLNSRIPETLMLMTPLVPLIAIELVVRPYFPWHNPNLLRDWASIMVYVVMLLSGAALVRWPELELALRKRWMLTAAAAFTGGTIYLLLPDWPLHGIGRALMAWGTIGTLIAFGPFWSRGRVPGEDYMRDAAFPLYVLHHLPLVVIAFAVKDLPWPVWERYFTIVSGAMAVAFTLYHYVVRPYNPVRIAFGLSRLPDDGAANPSVPRVPAVLKLGDLMTFSSRRSRA